MNRTTLSILLAIFFLFFTQSLVTALSCTIRFGGCSSGETCIFKLSDLTNAHAETCSQTNYNYSVCCSESGRALSTSCSGAYDGVIRLSSSTNAHVRDYDRGDGTYPVKICLSSDISTDNVDCILLSNDDCSSIGYECLASVSADDNAHVGDCGTYSTKICCSITECDVYITAADIGNTGYLINQSNTVYCLKEDVTLTSPITAITFNYSVANSTLDCMNHVINGSGSGGATGIEIKQSDTITVKNCYFFDLNLGILAAGHHHRIINNTFRRGAKAALLITDYTNFSNNLIDNLGEGIEVSGNYNNFINNIVRKCCIGIKENPCEHNYYQDGSVERDLGCMNPAEYKIEDSTPIVVNTNFSEARVIYIESHAIFNYSEDGDIWLATSGSGHIYRELLNWSLTNLSWKDWKDVETDANTANATYNITGLYPNTEYYIYNNSVFFKKITTTAQGSLEFNITLEGDGTSHFIEVTTTAPPCTYALTIDPTSDTKYTTSYNFAINATDASSPTCSSPITYNITYALTGDCQSVSVTPSFQIEQGGTLSPAFWVNISRKQFGSSCTVDINVTAVSYTHLTLPTN